MNTSFLSNLLRKTGVYDLDPSDIQVYICDKEMMDITKLSLKSTVKRRTEVGIHQEYHTYVEVPHHYTIDISFLYESADMYFMEGLEKAIGTVGSYFEMAINFNGRFIGTFDCYFPEGASEDLDKDMGEKSYQIIGVRHAEQYLDLTGEGMDLGMFETFN